MFSASCIGVVRPPSAHNEPGECPGPAHGIDFHFFSWINQIFSPRKSSQQPLDQLASDCPLRRSGKNPFHFEQEGRTQLDQR